MNSRSVILRLLVFLAAVLLIACLLSPPLYWLGTALADRGILPLQGFPFHRYFSRCLQITTLVLLWPTFQSIGIRRFSELGIERNPQWLRDLGIGFAMALVPVVLLSAAYIATDVYALRKSVAAATWLRILGTAGVVAVLEEFLFRGVLLGLCLRSMRAIPAVLTSSGIFALVHFLRVAKPTDAPPVTWLSGFAQIPQAFSSAPAWPLLGWGILSLLLAGILLAVLTLRTRSLFLAIGIHAGWILSQQGLQAMAKFRIKPHDALLPWVGQNVVSGAVPTGLLPAALLLLTGAAGLLYVAHVRRTS